MHSHTPSRKLAAAALSAGLLAVGCGDGGGDDGEVTLRFAWWGSDTRHELTQEVIDAFEEEHPEISIDPEFGSMDDHFDRLATQTAGGDAPDVIQMDERYLREYADRGALMPLEGVDVSEFDDTVVENGMVDGEFFAATMGVNTHVLVANPGVFEEADLEIPEDTSWTWDDFTEITADLTEGTEEAWGTTGPRGSGLFQTWMRQHGLNMNTDGGELGFSADDAASYLQYFSDLVEDGTMPEASLISEQEGLTLEQGLAGTGQEGIGPWWSNEVVGLSSAVGNELVLLRYPTLTGDVADSEPWLKSSMYLSAAAGTEHPDEVELFIDFFVNSEEAGLIEMAERGIPPNESVREAVVEEMDDGVELAIAEFVEDTDDYVSEPEPIAPAGGSEFSEIINRYEMEVYFGHLAPEEAAERMVAEMEGALE